MTVQQWGIKRRRDGKVVNIGNDSAGKRATLRKVLELQEDKNEAWDPITREIPDFHITFNPLQDGTVLCNKRSCLHPYRRHWDTDDDDDLFDMSPRASCKYCNCMSFEFEPELEPELETTDAALDD